MSGQACKATEVGPTTSHCSDEEAPGGNAQDLGNSSTLETIASLHTELHSHHTVDIIDARINQFSTTIRRVLTALKSETNTAISAAVIEHASKLADLECNLSSAADTITKLEQEVVCLNKVVRLSDKCIDLERCSRRQNLWILYVKKGAEAGKNLKDLVAQLSGEMSTYRQMSQSAPNLSC